MEEFESSMYGTIFRKYGSSNVLEFHKKLTTKPLLKEFNATSTKVLIKVHATSVNPLDCRIRKGDYFNSYYPALPHILGKDASGVVVAVGKNVSKFSIGDEVCGFLPQFTPSTGTYSQYTCFEQSQLVKKPENISHLEAAALTFSGSAAYHCLIKLGKLQKGQTVLIHGASGGVGSFAIQIAKHFGATVYTTSSKENLEHCRQLGSNFALNHERAFENSFSTLLDLVLDLKGNLNDTIQEYMSPKSTYISLVNKSTLSSLTQTFLGFISGVSHHFPTITPDVDVLSSVAKLVSDKSIRVFIGHSYALCDVKKAHEYVEKGDSVGKVILDVIDALTPKVEIQIESTNENDLPVERESLPKRKSKDMTRDSTPSTTKDQHFHDLLYEEEESKPKLNEETKVEELKEEEQVTGTESNPFEETHETSNPFEENSTIEPVPKEEEEQEVSPGFSDVNI